MKKEIKVLLLGLGIIISGFISLLVFQKERFDYFMIGFCLTLVLIIALIVYIKNNRSPEIIYKSKLNNILKTYDGILINSNNMPKISGKNIILVETMQDLIDAQMEIRKPIYYKRTLSACSFILLDTNEAIIYDLKLNNEVKSAVDEELKRIKLLEEKKEELDESILKEIENTTIILLKDKAYKISPIKKEEKSEIIKVPEQEIELL